MKVIGTKFGGETRAPRASVIKKLLSGVREEVVPLDRGGGRASRGLLLPRGGVKGRSYMLCPIFHTVELISEVRKYSLTGEYTTTVLLLFALPTIIFCE